MKKIGLAFIAIWITSTAFGQEDTNKIQSSGDVGIGTTSPSTLLDVNGTARFGMSSDGGIQISRFTSSLTDVPGSTGGIHLQGPLHSHLVFDVQGNDHNDGFYIRIPTNLQVNPMVDKTAFAVKSNGRVGIGTASPSYLLDVNGTSRFSNDLLLSESKYIYLGNNNNRIRAESYGDIGIYPNANLYIGAVISGDETKNVSFLENGNVGIGTTTVDDKLHLKQRSGDAVLKIENTGNGNASIIKFSRERTTGEDVVGGAIGLVSNTGTNWGQLFFNARSGAADVGVDGSGTQTPFLTLGNGVNNNVAVGIGTNTPKNALDVVGTIRSTEVKVEATPWPDYVFADNYQLRTLKETKEYIQENKHLPEIPSATEIEANGVELGDMNMRLLKKIEELTLYQIELMEKLEQQNEELQNVKKELKELKK